MKTIMMRMKIFSTNYILRNIFMKNGMIEIKERLFFVTKQSALSPF